MNEIHSPQPDIRPGEESLVHDPAEAETMAYAEKPFREEAIELQGLIDASYKQQQELRDAGPLSDDFEHQTRHLELQQRIGDKRVKLGLAHDTSVRQANDAGKRAQKQYLAAKQ